MSKRRAPPHDPPLASRTLPKIRRGSIAGARIFLHYQHNPAKPPGYDFVADSKTIKRWRARFLASGAITQSFVAQCDTYQQNFRMEKYGLGPWHFGNGDMAITTTHRGKLRKFELGVYRLVRAIEREDEDDPERFFCYGCGEYDRDGNHDHDG